MSEYIVAGAEPNNTVLKSVTKNGYEHEKWLPVREEIVRCRDCEFYDGEPDIDSSEPKCWRDPDHRGTTIWTRPDGFCAWGEKVVDE